MLFKRLPSDIVSEILINLPIIERKRLCRTSKLFQFANKKCPTNTLDFESFYSIIRRSPQEISNLVYLKPTINVLKAFRNIRCLECPLFIAKYILEENKRQDYFQCISTLNTQSYHLNDNQNIEENVTISDLLRNIIDTKLQHSLQTLIVDEMDFFFQNPQQTDAFNMLSKLCNLRSLTFNYINKYDREHEKIIVNYFLNHETIRMKTETQKLNEKKSEDYDSDNYSDTSYNTDWDKFDSLFERLRSYLTAIEYIKIQNIEIDPLFYIILSICLHENLKHLDLEIERCTTRFSGSSYLHLFSGFYYNSYQTWNDFGFYDVCHFIPDLLSLNTLSIYPNIGKYSTIFKDNTQFVFLLEALTQIVEDSEQLKTLKISSWIEILNKDRDAVFDLDTVISNYCISHLVFKCSETIQMFSDSNIRDLNVWKPLFWFSDLLSEAKHNMDIKTWLQNTLEYFEFYISVRPDLPPYDYEWKNELWNARATMIPNILIKIAMECNQYNIEYKILIEFDENQCIWDVFKCGDNKPAVDLWIDFLGSSYAKRTHVHDPTQPKICHYFDYGCCC